MATITELSCCLDKLERRVDIAEGGVLGGYLVDELPTSAPAGARAFVTDADSPISFAGDPQGGGSGIASVFFTGTGWLYG